MWFRRNPRPVVHAIYSRSARGDNAVDPVVVLDGVGRALGRGLVGVVGADRARVWLVVERVGAGRGAVTPMAISRAIRTRIRAPWGVGIAIEVAPVAGILT